jgi:hypothetical protein
MTTVTHLSDFGHLTGNKNLQWSLLCIKSGRGCYAFKTGKKLLSHLYVIAGFILFSIFAPTFKHTNMKICQGSTPF